MRSILIATSLITQFFLVNLSFADAYEECRLNCVAAKDSRDAECPSPYDYQTADATRDQCLKDSRDAYDGCVSRCPVPAVETPIPPAENNPAPMGY